jgi:zinc transporter ZupT
MSNHLLLLALLTLLVTTAEFLGAVFVNYNFTRRRSFFNEYLIALGAGFTLAFALADLIPESFELIKDAPLYVIAGYCTIHFFEHTLVGHFHYGEETHIDEARKSRLLIFAGFFVHSITDGVAIAASLKYSVAFGVLTFVAVALHKFPEGFTIASVMLTGHSLDDAEHSSPHSESVSKRNSLLASLALSLGTVVGIAVVEFLVSMDKALLGKLIAFSGGTVLYLGATDLVPEINLSHNRKAPLVVFAGMVLFYLAIKLVESF